MARDSWKQRDFTVDKTIAFFIAAVKDVDDDNIDGVAVAGQPKQGKYLQFLPETQ